tara:strand:- start:2527 stop:3750 length:1224 start_codon:yes stop_codon:yes gene_type:complete
MLVTVAYGGDVSGALSVSTIIITSSVPGTISQEVDTALVSTQKLFDLNYINDTSMNMELHESGDDVPFMPGTKDLLVLYAWNNAGTEETTQAQSPSSDDMILPGANGEIYEFGLGHQSTSLRLTVGTPLVKFADTDEITWEYYNGSWVALSDVIDDTDSLTISGAKSITWTVPDNWTRETLHGQEAFWVRANLTAGGPLGTAPSGTQASNETGRIFYYVDSITSIDQLNYDLYTGGVDIRTYHNYFPGAEGIQTADVATLEPFWPGGTNRGWEWKFDVNNAFRIDTNESGFIFRKLNSLDLTYSNTAVAGGDNTIIFSSAGSVGSQYIAEWTHNEEDGEGYYSNLGTESYSKALYNGASNYITARQEDDADVISNTSSEVISHKVGQAFDKSIDTASAFGEKLIDPS